jgi:hypothetical protein
MEIKQNILNAVTEWLTPTFDATHRKLSKEELLAGSPKELEESFYKTLNWNCGMRGVMGVGNNRINKYTL